MSFSTSKKYKRVLAAYSDQPIHSDSHADVIDVDREHAILVITKENITVSIRREFYNVWKDISVPAGSYYKVNVSKYDLMNIKLDADSSPHKVLVRSLGRAFHSDDASLEDEVDEQEALRRKFEWLPKQVVISG